MNKIRYLDDKHGNVYFEAEPNKNSKYASIALIKKKLLKDYIDKAIKRNNEKK